MFPQDAPLDGASTNKKARYGPANNPICEANWDGREMEECGKGLHRLLINPSPKALVIVKSHPLKKLN